MEERSARKSSQRHVVIRALAFAVLVAATPACGSCAEACSRPGGESVAVAVAVPGMAVRAEPSPEPSPATSAAKSPEAQQTPDSRPASPDVPSGSLDPLQDGLNPLVRELVQKGFVESELESLASRIALILTICDLGDDAFRVEEAQSLSRMLFEISRDYRPVGSLDPKRTLANDEEQRISIMAKALARDLCRRRTDGPYRDQNPPAPSPRPIPRYEVVEWKTLGGFDYTEGMQLPEEVRRLHGKKVVVAGYMYTLDEIENIKHFLVGERQWFRYSDVPNAHQIIEVTIDGRQGVEYSSPPVMLHGTLEVGEEMEEDMVISVYRLRLDGPQGVKPFE